MIFIDTGGQPLLAAVTGQEGLEIALGDPNGGTEAVRNDLPVLDPAAHRARGDTDHLRDLGGGEEPHVFSRPALPAVGWIAWGHVLGRRFVRHAGPR